MQKNKKVIIGALLAVVLVMAVGYAAFATSLNIKGTSSISSNWDVHISNVETKETNGNATDAKDPTWDKLSATVSTNLSSPGDYKIYTITVTNAGSIDAVLRSVKVTDSNNPAIKFETSGMPEGTLLLVGKSDTLDLKVMYSSDVTSQPSNLSSNIKVELTFEQKTESDTGPKQTVKLDGKSIEVLDSTSTEDGLYQDSVEPDKYFYRGKNPDNYITFNGDLYRIININEDGSLRIRRNESIGNIVFDTSSNGRYSSSGGYCNDSSYGCNVWGSNKTMRDANGNLITKMPRQVGETTTYGLPDKEAELNTYLNGTWYQTLTDTSSVKTNSTYNVGLLIYDSNYTQTLATDIEQEKAYTWQGNVGLIEISDYPRTNTNQSLCGTVNLNNYSANHYSTCKNTSWIYNSSNLQWSLSPSSYSSSGHVWGVYSGGTVRNSNASLADAVRPVLNLKSGITLVGTGKSTDPFTVQG